MSRLGRGARLRSTCSIALLAGAALGCRSEAAPPSQVARSIITPPAETSTQKDAEPTAKVPTLEALAARAGELAPGMREAARGEGALPAIIPLPPATTDGCVRVVVGSSDPVVAALVAEGGKTLEVSQAATEAVLGARGPICRRKGHDAHVEVQGPGHLARYVIWATP